MTDRLPGMPIAIGDPGVFVCGPDDIAPWKRRMPSGKPYHPGRAAAAAAAAPTGVWLVLRNCRECGPLYCRSHDATNWWLENFRPPSR